MYIIVLLIIASASANDKMQKLDNDYINKKIKTLNKELLEKNPSDPSRYVRAESGVMLTNPIEDKNDLLKCNKGNPTSCANVGTNFFNRGKKKESIKYYKKSCMGGKDRRTESSCEMVLSEAKPSQDIIKYAEQFCKIHKKSPCPELAQIYKLLSQPDSKNTNIYLDKSLEIYSKLCDFKNYQVGYIYCYDYMNVLYIKGENDKLKENCNLIDKNMEKEYKLFFNKFCQTKDGSAI